MHPFFLGTQFHPEFLARPLSPHPLFTGFMKAAKERNKNKPAETIEMGSAKPVAIEELKEAEELVGK
jgi:hypothetical protein